MNWSLLVDLSKGTFLTDIDMEGEHTKFSGNLIKLGNHQFCYGSNVEISGKIAVKTDYIMWAASDGSARRAYLREIESDDGAEAKVPVELLPSKEANTYGAIIKALTTNRGNKPMESAAYRVMTDGAFIHRAIEIRGIAYYFRSLKGETEVPYAIGMALRDNNLDH